MDVFLEIFLNFSEQLKSLSNWFVKESEGQLFSLDVPACPVFHFKSLNGSYKIFNYLKYNFLSSYNKSSY